MIHEYWPVIVIVGLAALVVLCTWAMCKAAAKENRRR